MYSQGGGYGSRGLIAGPSKMPATLHLLQSQLVDRVRCQRAVAGAQDAGEGVL